MAKIDGIDDLLKDLDGIADIEDELDAAMRKWTEYIRGEAADLCPVDTGELRQSILTDLEHNEEGVVGIVYTNKEYAPFVEFGTGIRGQATHDPAVGHISYSSDINGQAAQPFMYPALNNNIDYVMKGLKADIQKAMRGGGQS